MHVMLLISFICSLSAFREEHGALLVIAALAATSQTIEMASVGMKEEG